MTFVLRILMLKFRHLIVYLMLGSLLLTQLAVAAYVCPAQAKTSQMVMMQMEDCDGMDTMQPALCQELADASFDQRAIDPFATPTISPYLYLSWTQVLRAVEMSSFLLSIARENQTLARLHAPPLRVLHCSFLH